MAIQRFDLCDKSSVVNSTYGMFVTYADHEADAERRRGEATDYFRKSMDQCLRDGLVALAGAVCTPERGYIEDGGFNQFLADIKELRRQYREWRAFAGYCRSCALSGESDPQDFETFRQAKPDHASREEA